ncbi:MAG: EamA family transporter, partial [Muribaculaceae bacterium]|nr:EamA family transporter [Muribaculaceae bacterium]
MTNNSKSIVLAGVAVLSWSTVATAFKIALRSLSVFDMLLVSTVTAMLIFAFMMTAERKWGSLRELPRRVVCGALGLGVLNPVVYYLVLFRAY